MKALVSRPDQTRPLVVDRPEPEPGPGEIRLSVVAAAINPADRFVTGGPGREAFGLDGEVGLGYDAAGTVSAVGAGVEGFAVGDRVAALHDDLAAPIRAQAQSVVVPATSAARVPDGLELRDAASVPLNALTAAQALDLLGAPVGRELLVTGAAGAVGGYALALAAALGWSVTGLARSGDEAFVRSTGSDFVTQATPGAYDAVFDAAGLQEDALPPVRDGGSFVGVYPPFPVSPERGISVEAVQVRSDGARLAELLERSVSGELAVRVAGTAPLEDAAAAYDHAGTGGVRGRWLLLP